MVSAESRIKLGMGLTRLTKLKRCRLERGVLQLELARRARISRSRLSELECGYSDARPDELARIASALGVALCALIEDQAA